MTLAGLVALALLDSINPSAIVVTLYLLSRPRPAREVGVYVSAIFVTYFTVGATMLLGLDALWPWLGPALDSRAGLAGQGLVGAALLAWSFTPMAGGESPGPPAPPSRTGYVALAALGVTVTVMELPTAMPYLGAIAILKSTALPIYGWAPLLGVYNVIFVAPPLLLLAAHLALGERLASRYAGLRRRLERGAQDTARWIAGFFGGGLAVWSAIELLARLR